MTSTHKFIIKLLFLLIPAAILSCLLLFGGSHSNGIGGGSYDLSGMIYGMLLFAVIVVWWIVILINTALQKSKQDIRNNIILLVIGVLAFIIAYMLD